MQKDKSIYLSVLDNQWQPMISHNYDHDLNQQTTCKIVQQLQGIKQLKQKYPQINVQIHHTGIKKLSNGIYIGQLNSQQKPQGYGIIRYEDKSIVQAQFKDGKAYGKGFKWFGDDWYYVGDFFDNNFDGRGQYKSPSITYNGQFKNNTFHGHGELTLAQNKSKFIGEMENGQMKNGTLTWETKNTKNLKQILKFQYKGQFKNGQFHGDNCTLTASHTGRYEGSFRQGQKWGQGKFLFHQKYQYIGDYQNNVKCGYGTLFNPEIKIVKGEQVMEYSELQKNISYRGQFERNLPHGKGQVFKQNQGKLASAQYVEGIWTEALKGSND